MNDVNNAHKVKRSVVRILASLGIGMVVFGALGGAAYVFAIPPVSPYDPNETLDPTCAPGDTNCTVVTPVAGTGALGQIGFFSGTSTIASDSKFTFSSSTGDLGLVSDSAQFKLGALSDVGITRSVAGTLKITDGSTGLGSIHIGGMTFGTASGLLKATAGVVSTATSSDADLILPTQTGNSGKYLTTNGATSSWATVPSSQWTTSGSGIYYDSGNVGIGTVSPLSKLHVSGGARVDGDTGNATLAGYLSSSTLNVYNGNTTDNNYASIGFSSYFERTGLININGAPAAGMGAQFLSHVSASSFNFPTDLYFWTGYSAIGEGLGIPASEKMRITAAGNVGIGTSTPRGLLEVASSTSKTTLFAVLPNGYVGIGTATPSYGLQVTGSSYLAGNAFTANGGYFGFGGSNSSIYGSSAVGSNYMAFYTSSTERMRINHTGNVLIGTSTASGVFVVATSTATSPLLSVLNNGSVYMGVSTQGFGLLNMNSDGTVTLRNTAGANGITFTGGTASSIVFNSDSTVNAQVIKTSSANSLTFGTNNTERMRIDSTGNVLIATTTTSTALLTLGAATTTTITDLLINPAAKNAGNLIDAQVGGVSKFKVSNTGYISATSFSTSDSTFAIAQNAVTIGAAIRSTAAPSSDFIPTNGGFTILSNATASNTGDGANISLGHYAARTNISGTRATVQVYSNYNQSSGTAANTDLLINRTETAVGSGAQYLIDAQVGGVSKFKVNNQGAVTSGQISTNNSILVAGGSVQSDTIRNYLTNNTLTLNATNYSTAGRFAVTLGGGTHSQTTGTNGALTITPIYNQVSGGAANTDLLINRTETAVGSGAQYLIDAQVGGVSKFSISNTGVITGAANFSVNASGYVSAYQVNATSFVATNAAPLTSGAFYWAPTITNTSDQVGIRIAPTYNQASGTAANTDLLINRTQTAVGSGAQYLIDAQVGGVSKFSVTSGGIGTLSGLFITNSMRANDYYGLTTANNASGTAQRLAWQTYTNSSGVKVPVEIAPVYNQSGTAGATDLLINRTQTAVGSGAQNLIDAQVGGVSKFSVSNTGNVLIGTSTASGVFVVATSTATSPLLTVLNNGNVGIGTSTPSNVLNIDIGSLNNAGITLSTNGSTRAQLFRGGTGGAGRLTLSADGQTNLVDLYPTSGYSFSNTVPFSIGTDKFVVSSGNVGIGTSTPQGLLEVASSTSKTTLFTVLPNGNVGIGTTTPASKLEVVDAGSSTSIYASGVNNFQSFVMRKSDVANGIKDWIFQKREDTFFGGSAGSFIIYGDNYSGGGHSSYIAPIIFNTNGNILMAAASNATNGYVGIGTVSPAALLEVNSNIVTAYGAGLESRNSASGYAAGTSGFYPLASAVGSNDTVIKYAAGTNSFVIKHGTDNVMAIDQNGNMGVGTTTPSERLHIYDASDSTIVVGRAGSPTTLSEWSYNGGVVSFGSRASDAVQFIYNNSQKILLNGAGVSVSSGTNFNVDAGTLYVDSTYDRVGIATTSTTTSAVLTIGAATTTTLTDLLINPSAKNAGNLIDAQIAGVSKFSVTNAGSLTAVAVSASSGFFGTATTLNANYLRNGVSNSRTGDGYLMAITGAAARTNTSGNQQFFAILPSYNQASGTSSNVDLFINRTETAVGSGAQYLIDAQVGNISKFNVTNLGRGYFADGISIATSSTSYGLIVGNGSTQKDIYIPKGGLCVDDDNAGCASTPTAGTIYAKATAITGIDVAEHYPTNDISLESGDVVSFSTQNSTFIEKSTASSTRYLAGVISTEPGVLLGKNIENARPVALNGRVPVKVSNENGAINIGDYLTVSSQPGVAAKATSPGMTIGMALETYNQSGVGKITVFVRTGFALGSSEAASGGEGGLITLLTRTFASIGITIENGITSIKQLIVDKITTKELCVEDLCLNKEQLKFILDRNGITIGSPIPPQESLPPAPTPPVTASSTEEAIPTETPAETPIETPVPTQAPPEPTASETPPSPEPSASPSEQTQSPTETVTPETPSQ